ncbi:MAG: peptidylprolyl isomerase [Acidobacteriaceae bacterium]
MMFKAVVRTIIPLGLAATFCLYSAGQTDNPAPSTHPPPVAGAATLGASTSLGASSNELANIYGTPVEQIVARVNDRVITNSDIARAKAQLAEESRQNNWSLDEYNDNEKNLLRDLIDQQLLLSKGKQLGITGDTELIKRLDDIRKQNHLDSMDELEKAVEQQGTSYEDFKANIRNSIITQQVVRDEVGSKIQLPQPEIQKYYEEHQANFTQAESIHLKEILIPTPGNPTGAELAAADAKTKGIESQLKTGGNFSDLAKKYSSGPTAQQGGDLGDFKRGALAKVLEDQTFDLPVGSYTEPIRTRQGYIILQVTAHIPGGTQPLQKVEPEIEQALYMQQIEPAVRRYLTLLRDQAYIDIRPGYTDSAASPNETKPTFEASVPALPKKKTKKARYERKVPRGRMANRKVETAAVSTGAAAGATVAGAAKSGSTGRAGSAHYRKVSGKEKKASHKTKPVKFRYGRTPVPSVAEEQVATTAGGKTQATEAEQANAAEQTAPGTGVQPLGPDLEHNPTINKPKQEKRRFSDEARDKLAMEARKNHTHKTPKVKKVKVDNARPSPLSGAESQNQQVQSAPLGLNGDTVHKKKKKKVRVKNGEKTRMSDQKKDQKQKGTPPATQGSPSAPSNSGSTSPAAAANPS